MPILPEVGRRSLGMRIIIASIYTILIVGSVTMIYPFAIMLGSSLTSDFDYLDFAVVPRYLYDATALRAKHLANKYSGDYLDAFRTRYNLPVLRYDQVLGDTYELDPSAAGVTGRNGTFRSAAGALLVLEHRPVRTDEGTLEAEGFSLSPEGDILDAAGAVVVRRRDTLLKDYDLSNPGVQARLRDWLAFAGELPGDRKTVFFYDGYLNGRIQRRFQAALRKEYNNNLEALKSDLDENKDYFEDIDIIRSRGDGHRWRADETPIKRKWDVFKATLEPEFYLVFSAKELWVPFLEIEFPSEDTTRGIDILNARWNADYAAFAEIEFPLVLPPPDSPMRDAWVEFVRKRWPVRWLRLNGGEAAYHGFLAAKYETIDRYNRFHKTEWTAFEQVAFTETEPEDSTYEDWCDYIDVADPETFEVLSMERLYIEHLQSLYADLDALNGAYATRFDRWDRVRPPYGEADAAWYEANQGNIRNDFVISNYRTVITFVTMKGRALFNTFVLVVATIATQLTIMPMAAFALSRFRLRYANKILLFLLATMAFPAEVAMIPNFLLMKELHMLNTYWALVLPGVANGFGIFLLKGFFDSLPDELYEAGTIDGASEWTLFFRITLPLSKPILAVIGLGAFGAAYGGFMWAFLICQKENMWTLMVFLYQFQQTQSQPVVMASLVVAAIPTLLVFIFCQNIILRGIVIPMAK